MRKGIVTILVATAILFASSVSYAHPPDKAVKQEPTIEKIVIENVSDIMLATVDYRVEAIKTSIGKDSPIAIVPETREGVSVPAFADLRSCPANTSLNRLTYADGKAHYSKLGYSMAN